MNQPFPQAKDNTTQLIPPPGSFARYSTLDWDRQAYADVNHEGRRRRIIRMISRAPDAPIQARHNFQIGSIDSSKGNGPTLHAHDYPEIFIPIRSGFFVDYGITGQHRARLNTYDAYSIPLNVLRKFEAFEESPQESQMLSIFDTPMDDARTGIKVSAEVAAADEKAGMPQDFEISDDLVDADPQEVEARHIARFKDLAVERHHGLLLRRLISSGNPRAALRTQHNIEVDYLELPAGTRSEEWSSDCREVLVPLEGDLRVFWDGQPIDMERLDVLSIAPSAARSIEATGNESALLLRVRDLSNTQ